MEPARKPLWLFRGAFALGLVRNALNLGDALISQSLCRKPLLKGGSGDSGTSTAVMLGPRTRAKLGMPHTHSLQL